MNKVDYSASKIATDRLVLDMTHELRGYGVAALWLYPGLVHKDGMMENEKDFDLSNSESPYFIGHVVAALAMDPRMMEKSGKVLVVASLGLEYGFNAIDSKQLRPLTL
jgi:NADP-dependent 3-hydroxy acid dehydrogenase YdfG